MRYTRAGKSTHQRVPQDSTPWDDLKASEAEQKQRFQKNKSFSKNGDKPSEGQGDGNNSKKGDRNNFKNGNGNNFKNGNGNNFKNGDRNNFKNGDRPFKRQGDRNNQPRGGDTNNPSRGIEESANFTKLGERLKPGEDPESRNVQGYGKSKQVKIFGKFWVPVEDATRLKALSKKLKEEGLSRNQIWDALLNERRKAEKVARRARDKICFNCRQFGHVLMDCPNAKGDNAEGAGDGLTLQSDICFKCGSTEHTSRDCKKSADKFDFAKCFICSKTGHIARQCPENTRGIYPKGGCCNICKEATHLAKDCPTLHPDKPIEAESVTGRVVDPFTSLEYEGDSGSIAPETVSDAVPSTENKTVRPKQTAGEPRAKKRKVKF